MRQPFRVLFLCTHNSARSQMAEAILRHLTRGRFDVMSAGADPAPRVHSMALLALDRLGIDTRGLHPKHVSGLSPRSVDCVVTVCDSAHEQCPVFPGPAERLHWNVSDPTRATGMDEQRERAFSRAAAELMTRTRLWLSLPEMAVRLSEAPSASASRDGDYTPV